MIYFGQENAIEVKNRYDYIALAEAIDEINNFYSLEDRWVIHNIIKQTKLDVYLLRRYRKSIFKFQKKYFLSRLIHLQYPPLKSFFLEIMKFKDNFIKKYALYGFAMLSSTSTDLEEISLHIRNSKDSKLGYQFYGFIFEQILKHNTPDEIYNFVSKLTINDTLAAKSILYAIGNVRVKELSVSAEKIYKLFKDNDEFIICYIETMKKLGIKNCDIIKENYLSQNDHIRQICSANAFTLCNKEALEFLYIYFFDKNKNVRLNILKESKKINLKPQDILRIIDKKRKDMDIDKFAISMIESW